jgi:acylphosphatase
MGVVTKQLTVRGRVQGVCFRAWTVQVASELGLRGWVRNRANGDVETVVQGEQKAVESFLKLVWAGPPAARVDAVDVHDEAAAGDLTSFRQKATF